MKTIYEMTDTELSMEHGRLKTSYNYETRPRAVGSPFPFDTAKCEELLNAMREIRVEMWRRGIHAPTADERGEYVEDLEDAKTALASLDGSKRTDKIYSKRYIIAKCVDAIAWIDGELK